MKTAAERQKEWRERYKAQGYQMITVWLEPDVAKALGKVSIESDKPFAERQKIINLALREFFAEALDN
jgi:hypothetical protein